MADAIYGLLNYPALSKVAAEKGHDEVNAIKWVNAAAKVKQVYQSVL
jgi:hypothetical protein